MNQQSGAPLRRLFLTISTVGVVLATSAGLAWAAEQPAAETVPPASAGETPDSLAPEQSPAPSPPSPIAPAPAAPAPALNQPGESLEDRLRDAERRLDEVERAASLQRLQWSGDYRTIVSSFRYHGPSPDGARGPDGSPAVVDITNAELWLHRARLNLRAEPVESVRFTARITAFKRFGSNVSTPFPQDSSQTRIPGDAGLRFERMWLDWFLTDWLALSVGRISYTDGPPNELKENRSRADATWGQQMVDGEYETADLTASVGDRLLVRAFYASWEFPRTNDVFSSFTFLNDGTENLRIVGGNVDLKFPELGNNLTQLGAFWVPRFRPFPVPIPNPSPPANPTNAPTPFDGSLLFPSAKPASLGSYSNLSMLTLWKDIARSGLDLFGAGALGFLRPNDEAIAYPLGPGGEAVPLLVLASADSKQHTTYFFYVGGRFRMPFGDDLAPKLGFEYNYGSRYLISFATPTSTLTNKLANRGDAYEIYYIQPINEHLFIRSGYVLINTRYSGGFFGPSAAFGGTAPAVDQRLQGLHFILDATF